jgi:hypothetical protein
MMGLTKFAAGAVLTAAALGVTAGSASGQVPAANHVVGANHGVTYTSTWKSDGSSVTTSLTGGTFRATANGAAVAVTAANGATVGDIPLVYTEAGRQIRIQPQINSTGTTLTLDRPAGVPAHQPNTTALKDIGFYVSNQTIIDVAVGCVLGAVVGAIFGVLPGIPGCIIGGVIGYFYAGNPI